LRSVVSDQHQARPVELQGSKLKSPAQEPAPPQTRGKPVGAKKIFIAKRRIFADRDCVGIQLRSGEKTGGKFPHFHRPSERALQLARQERPYAHGSYQQRGGELQRDRRQYYGEHRFPPFSYSIHGDRTADVEIFADSEGNW